MLVRSASALLAGLILLGFAPSAATADSSSPAGSASPAASGASSGPGDRATWGIGPLPLSPSDTRSFFSIQTGPGGSYADKAVLVNYAVVSQQLTVYAADLGNGADGDIAVGLQADQPRDAGGWIKLPGKVLTVQLPPRRGAVPGEVVLPFQVAVPHNASPGDHGAAIVAVLSTLGKNSQGQNVRLDQRLATRIYLRVNGELQPKLAIENLRVRYAQSFNPMHGGVAIVSYTVHNTGNVRLGAQQAVSVTGMFGIKSKVVTPAALQLLFPGAEERVTVRVPGVCPALFEKSHVMVTPQLFADQPPMQVPRAVASSSFLAIPWGLLEALVLIVLVSLLIWYLRRRASRQPLPKHGRKAGSGGPGPKPLITPPTREKVTS